ncbi:MAG TPA: hypothetical protein VF815_41260 [Myxococcaceae bacterium]|jgi:ElaB/YqjD/DUF883 family membrane-anchored ribosome-binding protein
MSEIADELALHAQPDRVKAIASEKVSEWKELAKEKATEKVDELKQQAKDAVTDKATEIKTRAKEAVMQGTTELKERADTPRGWSLLGAIVGAGVGAVLMKKAFSVREQRTGSIGHVEDFRYRGESYPTFQRTDTYGSPAAGVSGDVSAMGSGSAGIGAGVGTDTSGGIKDRAMGVAHTVQDKAHDLRERAMGAVGNVRDQASNLRERIPSGSQMKTQASDWFDRALETQPLMLAVGGIALGMFASMFLPVTNRERQLIEPAKRKAQESITQLGDQLEQKLQGNAENADEGLAHDATGGMSSMGSGVGTMGGSASMMGAERPSLMDEDEDRSDSLASPTGSRIPPLPPLDDLTPKIH